MSEVSKDSAAVIAVAASYWAGEAEVVQTYFRHPRTLSQDLFWLRAQACKETRVLRDLPSHLQEEFLRAGTIARHPEGPEAAMRMVQEMGHFRLLADLFLELGGEVLPPADLTPLPEDRKLQELRAAYKAQGGELERAAVDFTEGGGGAMFQVLSCIEGSEFERKVAAAFKIIAAEELSHGPAAIHTIARSARSKEDWQRVQTIVHAVSRQRLLMRNEMFGFPLSTARIQEIDKGKISPWPMPFLL